MTHFTLSQHAPAGAVFAPGCFDSSVGESLLVSGGTCKLIAYEIEEDGSVIHLTLDGPSLIGEQA